MNWAHLILLLCTSPLLSTYSTEDPSSTTSEPACQLNDDYTTVCSLHLSSISAHFFVIVSLNLCSSPFDLSVKLKRGEQLIWQHVFVNPDESQIIDGITETYATMQIHFAYNETTRLFLLTGSVKEDEATQVFIHDAVLFPLHPLLCESHYKFSAGLIGVIAFSSFTLLSLLTCILCFIRYKRNKSHATTINNLYAHQEEPLDNDAVEIGQSRCSTTLVRNVIFRGHCIGSAPVEDTVTPMIVEENDEYANWFAYENVPASRSTKKKKKARSKGKSVPLVEAGSNVPVIARPDALDANVTQWSYLPSS